MSCGAEVYEFNPSVLAKEDIIWGNISVENIRTMYYQKGIRRTVGYI